MPTYEYRKFGENLLRAYLEGLLVLLSLNMIEGGCCKAKDGGNASALTYLSQHIK